MSNAVIFLIKLTIFAKNAGFSTYLLLRNADFLTYLLLKNADFSIYRRKLEH
jgi:hypothetical protein